MTISKQTIVDSTDASNVYYGEADIQTPESTALWTIYRVTTDGDEVIKSYPCAPDGIPTDAPMFKWSDRASLTYSLSPI